MYKQWPDPQDGGVPEGVLPITKSAISFKLKFLPKTAWKWKNLDPRGGGGRPEEYALP